MPRWPINKAAHVVIGDLLNYHCVTRVYSFARTISLQAHVRAGARASRPWPGGDLRPRTTACARMPTRRPCSGPASRCSTALLTSGGYSASSHPLSTWPSCPAPSRPGLAAAGQESCAPRPRSSTTPSTSTSFASRGRAEIEARPRRRPGRGPLPRHGAVARSHRGRHLGRVGGRARGAARQRSQSSRSTSCPTSTARSTRGGPSRSARACSSSAASRTIPNRDAAHWLVEEIMPLVRRRGLPTSPPTSSGSSPTDDIRALESEDVRILGWVPDLANLYEHSRLSVAPLRYGAGVKGKVGESMAHGLPVVTTRLGAEGMGLEHEHDVLVAEGPQAFANEILRAYHDADFGTASRATVVAPSPGTARHTRSAPRLPRSSRR